MNIDEWFKTVREKYPEQMQCGKGCTACCHGLFDITLSDALEITRAFSELSADTRQRLQARANALHHRIRDSVADLQQPAIFSEDDNRIDQIVDAIPMAPCPCLGDAGQCLIYDRRPLACRLEGVPMVDVREGPFGDWCELNFKEGLPESALADLEQDYDRIDEIQESESAVVARRAKIPDARAVTFIPSVIAEYESFWKRWL